MLERNPSLKRRTLFARCEGSGPTVRPQIFYEWRRYARKPALLRNHWRFPGRAALQDCNLLVTPPSRWLEEMPGQIVRDLLADVGSLVGRVSVVHAAINA